jgi:hypothetical protein
VDGTEVLTTSVDAKSDIEASELMKGESSEAGEVVGKIENFGRRQTKIGIQGKTLYDETKIDY